METTDSLCEHPCWEISSSSMRKNMKCMHMNWFIPEYVWWSCQHSQMYEEAEWGDTEEDANQPFLPASSAWCRWLVLLRSETVCWLLPILSIGCHTTSNILLLQPMAALESQWCRACVNYSNLIVLLTDCSTTGDLSVIWHSEVLGEGS